MADLIIQQNELTYAGMFTYPAFDLWNEGKRILAGLYDAYLDYGITLQSIVNASGGSAIGDQQVVVNLGSRSAFTFRFDRIEAKLSSFADDDLSGFPDVLLRGVSWIRPLLVAPAFKLHLITYASHSSLTAGSSEELLKQLTPADVPRIGISRGIGVIYHFDIPQEGTRIQVTVDHSLAVDKGIYMQMHMVIARDEVDYQEILRLGRERLQAILASGRHSPSWLLSMTDTIIGFRLQPLSPASPSDVSPRVRLFGFFVCDRPEKANVARCSDYFSQAERGSAQSPTPINQGGSFSAELAVDNSPLRNLSGFATLVSEVQPSGHGWEAIARLIGMVEGPEDLAKRHDEYSDGA